MNPKLASVLKWIGVFDGAALAAVTALGHSVPAWQVWTHPTAEVLGALSTGLAAWGVSAAAKAPQQG